MRQALLTAVWVIGVVYASIPLFWLPFHPLAEYWRKRLRNPMLPLVGMWFVWIAILLYVSWPYHLLLLYNDLRTWIVAAPILVIGLGIYRRVRAGAFDSATLIGRTELDPTRPQKLVTGGIHGRVRHPVYLAHFLNYLALTFGSGLLVLWILLPIAFLTGIVIVNLEDAELERRFGEEFRQYKARVPALLPRLRG